jgi:hypothetical protein
MATQNVTLGSSLEQSRRKDNPPRFYAERFLRESVSTSRTIFERAGPVGDFETEDPETLGGPLGGRGVRRELRTLGPWGGAESIIPENPECALEASEESLHAGSIRIKVGPVEPWLARHATLLDDCCRPILVLRARSASA